MEPGEEEVTGVLSRLLVAGLLAVLGLAVTTQVQFRGGDESYESYREADLLSLVDGLDGSIRRSRAELARLRQVREQLRSDLADDELRTAQARDRIGPLQILQGLEPVRGPGVRVTIGDPDGVVGFDLVVDLVQDLRAAGATAIEFDDTARLGAESWISGLGGGITVDGTEVDRPYVIDVVGDPASLAGALDFPRGGADRMRRAGADVTFEQDTVAVTSTRRLPEQPTAEPTGPAL